MNDGIRFEPDTYTVRLMKQTDRAILVDHGRGTCWLPVSQVHIHADCPETGDVFDIEVPQWLAEERGLC